MKILIFVLIITVIAIAIADKRLGRKYPVGRTITAREKYRHYKLLIIIVIAVIALAVSYY